MTEDYFWGVSLSSSNKEHQWEPDALQENGESGDPPLNSKGEHALIIKQFLLGADAKEGELNVIEVETLGYTGNISIPIAVMKAGKEGHVLVDLNFPDPPVTFKLTQGSGPVHITGNHVINAEQFNDDDDDDLDEYDDEQEIDDEDEEELEETPDKKAKDGKVNGKKRASTNSQQSASKKKKKAA